MLVISERKKIIKKFNLNDHELEILLDYNTNNFDHTKITDLNKSRMADEPFVKIWSDYLKESKDKGIFNTLKEKLIQLNFSISDGISKTDYYQDATLKGHYINSMNPAGELILNEADNIELMIYNAPFGSLPMIIVHNREDFVSITRALAKKNEPVDIPDSMGASMISGYNNWDRINAYKNNWLKSNDEESWTLEFKNLINDKKLYQDKFVILSTGPYSNTSADQLGINEKEWSKYSLKIRTAHEYAHYFTKRYLSSMKNNLLDELIADYFGITNAINEYKSEWFLKFMGVDENTNFNSRGRLVNYLSNDIKGEKIKKTLSYLLLRASKNIEIFDKKINIYQKDMYSRYKALLAISYFTIEELSEDYIIDRLINKFDKSQF